MAKYKNTLRRSTVRYIVYRDTEDNAWYAVGLEFNIVRAGDSALEALLCLLEAIEGYIESAREIKAENVLNQKPMEEYEKMWDEFITRKTKESIETVREIYTRGELSLSYA
ncbi:hypothetical protein A2926_02265 [Candidatus Giovannonibacteria bacterium RIFCSPLOWO2_01_FULL_44_40]|uniref:Uncharacterized protein n=1 Tax=Candidatus Giovannonibacteria bacterium RIFCSPHIGHO2_01_FULL_45_23 TaxID=1798325 RepID=A0A1F5VHJ7_9BACT|nr:MAG: hypothetical protein A2834_02380 [Candidatus Giovannonibacteria bacterium RIFCSPHIGHO2_01_FULL_45_23]OGF76898.1 MAG: hypothetical protein A3C77_04700 [Candidatus Giovannonibacteria bacterium RIFCSPHIGHO2_02_FULL_45_13]OGF79977.1 MAG: hypothetical protein A2926_02265 [Candidatus Giovannonibacteria bacterium RIFCSPLOWO2_01_FULL_44_40]